MAAVFRGEARKIVPGQEGAMKGIVLYYVIVNIVLFLSMLWDKFCAIRHWRRIPEKWLLRLSLPGGGIGGFLGMALARHKIRKPRFWLVFGIALVLHILFWCYWQPRWV